MNIKDKAEVRRILEDCDEYVEALYEAAEWCYRTHKEAHEAEEFIEAVKGVWNGK